MTTILSKQVSYGKVEIRDHGAQSPRYSIWVNGQIKEYSDDYSTIKSIYDSKYY